MPNNLELAKIYQSELDKQVVAACATGFMELNSDQVKYVGGKEIKIPKISMDGLADYDPATGFTNGAITLGFETHAMTQDRNRSFSLDANEVDETAFAATAANYMGEFQKTQVIPEIDAYRISKIAAKCIEGNVADYGYVPEVGTILAELKADIAAVKDVAGDDVDLVIMMSIPVMAVLEQADGVSRFLNVGTLTKGDIQTQVKSLDGCPIVSVPSSRMKTAYNFPDGKTAGQVGGGFTPAAGAKNLNWVIVTKSAPIAVSKTDVVRIFTPEQNQIAHAWKVDYRKYHDLFIMDNKVPTCHISVKEAEV